MNEDTWYCVIEQYGSRFIHLSLVSKEFRNIVKRYTSYLENNCKPIIYKKLGYELFVTQKIEKHVGWCVMCKSYFRNRFLNKKIVNSRAWVDKKCIIDVISPRSIEISIQERKTEHNIIVCKKRIIIPKDWQTLYFKKQEFI